MKLRSLIRLLGTAALPMYFAAIPLALSSDTAPGEDAKISAAAPEAAAEQAAPAAETDASEAKSDDQATTAVSANGKLALDPKEWVCRKETPTGSHRAITACRRRADIEANSVEVEKTMQRQSHYGNPSVTPEG